MSQISAVLLSIFIVQALWTMGSSAEERRSDVRAVLGEPTEPGFWPTRGRRSEHGTVDDIQSPPIFWLQQDRHLLPVTLCADSQQLRKYIPDSHYAFPMKDTSQIKSWMRS